MIQYDVKDHEPSLLPEGKNWTLVWNDEFDGTELDRTKWDYRLCMMGKRHRPWTDDGVALDGHSNAVFSIFERDGDVCSSQLQTGYNYMDAEQPKKGTCGAQLTWPIGPMKDPLFTKKMGYFECRCRLQQHDGWWSAFWMQSPIIGATLHPETSGIENDIMESFHPGEVSPHANHYAGYADDHKCIDAGKGKKGLDTSVFHRFAMLWDETGYTFYIDGEEDGHIDGPISGVPEFLLISTEVDGYRWEEVAAPTEQAKAAAAAGDTFLVDYVRVFDCK